MIYLAIALALVGIAVTLAAWDVGRRLLAARAAGLRVRDDDLLTERVEAARRSVMDLRTEHAAALLLLDGRVHSLEDGRAKANLAKLGGRRGV